MSKETVYKGYKIIDGGFQTRKVQSIGKGALPKSLRGMYTNTASAQQAIDVHVNKKG